MTAKSPRRGILESRFSFDYIALSGFLRCQIYSGSKHSAYCSNIKERNFASSIVKGFHFFFQLLQLLYAASVYKDDPLEAVGAYLKE